MKICPNCKNQFPDDAKFCAICGTNITDVVSSQPAPAQPSAPEQEVSVQAPTQEAPVQPEVSAGTVQEGPVQTEASVQTETPVQNEAPASFAESDPKKSPVKMIAIIAAVAIMFLIIVVSMVSAFSGGSDFTEIKNTYSTFTNLDGDDVIVFNSKDVVTLDGNASNFTANADKTGVYFTIDDELQFVTKDDEITIDSDVSSLFTVPSLESETVIYTKESDDETFLYRWNGKEAILIDSDIDFVTAVSPNGETIAYVKDISNDFEDFDTYISKNGKEGKKVEDMEDRVILAISDDAKTSVVLDVEKEDYFIVKGRKEVKLASAEDLTEVHFNEDLSEVLFISDSKLYFSKNANEREKIANDISSVSICVPKNKSLPAVYNTDTIIPNILYSIDSFIGMTLFADDTDGECNLISFNKKLEVTTLAKNISSYVLTENEKTLFYIKNNDIYKMKAGKEGSEEKIASDIITYEISPDGKDVYYTNDDDELCYVNGKKIEIVGEDASYLRMADNGYLYYIEDRDSETYIGDLYCVKGKGKSEAVEGGEDTYSLRTAAGEVLFVSDYDTEDHSGTLYVADGKKSVQLAEEIRG